MRCYYEVLGIARESIEDDIKKAYRKLALQLHPDRHPEADRDEYTEKFKELTNAYQVLMDKEERAWYDSHRDQILNPSSRNSYDDEEYGEKPSDLINLWPYFSNTCYASFEDGQPNNFYSVYSKVFETLSKEEKIYKDHKAYPSKNNTGPEFGNSKTPYEKVKQFYSWWEKFNSIKSFAWMDTYRSSDASNRDMRRQIDKENEKARNEARNKFNNLVRELVKYVKRRDERVLQEMERKKQQMEEEKRKQEEEEELKKEAQKRLQEYHQNRLKKLKEMEKELEEVEDVDEEEELDEEEKLEDDLFAFYEAEAQRKKNKKKSSKVKIVEEEEEEVIEDEEPVIETLEEEETVDEEIESEPVERATEEVDEEEEEEVSITKSKKQLKKKQKKKSAVNLEKLEEKVQSVKLDSDAAPEEESISQDKSSKKKDKKKKTKQNKTAKIEEEEDASVVESSSSNAPIEKQAKDEQTFICNVCNEVFSTRNKLFDHIRTTGHALHVESKTTSKKKKK